jgi:hypothetical protein
MPHFVLHAEVVEELGQTPQHQCDKIDKNKGAEGHERRAYNA